MRIRRAAIRQRPALRRRAFLVFDLLAGISLVLIVLAGFSLAASRLSTIHKRTVMQRQVRDAAVCALDAIRIGGGDPREAVRQSGSTLAGQIEINVVREAGTGDWAGATRVSVEAVLDRGTQPPIREVIAGYVFGPEGGA